MKFQSTKIAKALYIFNIVIGLSLPIPANAWITKDIETDDFGDIVVNSYVTYDYGSKSSIGNNEDYAAFLEKIEQDGSGSWSQIVLRCRAKTLDLLILSSIWQDQNFQSLKFKKQNLITYRTNSSKASTWKTTLSSNNQALFLENTKTLISKISKSKTFSVKYQLSDGSYQSATFDVRNLSEVRPIFAEAGCKI